MKLGIFPTKDVHVALVGLPFLYVYQNFTVQCSPVNVVTQPEDYCKCSNISNNFLCLFSNEKLVFMAAIHKILVRLSNREDPDQTASEEAV